MADEQTLEAAIAENRATNPRLDAPAPEPALEPVAEPAPEPVAEEPVPEPTAEPEGDKKPKRTAVDVLTGRVGHLTKSLNAKDQEAAANLERANTAEARLRAAEELLAAQGKPIPEEGSAPLPAPTNVNPATGRVFTEAEFQAAVTERARADAFNKQADAMYDSGSQKFTDWKESVDMLNATGLMSPTLLDAAMATDDGAAVIHHLGNDLDELTRIAALPPIRMAAELTKMATRLSAPASVRVSGAPAPITPVNGAVNPLLDLERASGGGNDMTAYREARAKQGARWAQPKGERAR